MDLPPTPSDDHLFPLTSDLSQMRREAVKRRKPYQEKRISLTDLPNYEAQGWKVEKAVGKKAHIKKEKPLDQRLRNRLWMLMFKLGYPELSSGDGFSILIQKKRAPSLKKEIAVFAKDDETVVVAECRSSERVSKRNLQKDIDEFSDLKGDIAQAIHQHYGKYFKPKIIWLFVTENIIWSHPDRDRADKASIRVVTERELRYYWQIAEHLGKSARYQFLAEFLRDQPIPELTNKKVPSIRGRLGGHKFYCFVTRPRELLKISFVNHRSLNDPDGAPSYQRLVSRSRIREIGAFIKAGGFFPTNILINFTRKVRFDKISHEEGSEITFGTLHLPDKYRSAWIIDGQHRLYGFSPIDDRFLDQNIIVVAFEEMKKADEAQLFVTINHEQKTVPKHLLDDLEGELKWGSLVPSERVGAISSRLINLLNSDVGEPFHSRVTQQGIPSNNKTCLTIPALKDALRRSGLVGTATLNNSNYELGPLCGNKDSETLEKARCAINLYFNHIRTANITQWENGRSGVLCTNTAVQAHLRLLGEIIKYWEGNSATAATEVSAEEIISEIEEYIQPILDFIKESDVAKLEAEFRVPFGSGGPREYYYRLGRILKAKIADFIPQGMDIWEAEQSEDRKNTANQQLEQIIVAAQNHIFGTFKARYGSDAYLEKGVLDKAIKTKAYERSQEHPYDQRLPLESYIDVIDLKKIVEHKNNWGLFKAAFDIPEPGDKGNARNLKWIDRINELRRIAAHPSEKRQYKLEDYEYLDFLHEQFFQRLQNLPVTQSPAETADADTSPSDP